jgi:predicted hotdog family 3-hydroxylacyl-ACP dehydratase
MTPYAAASAPPLYELLPHAPPMILLDALVARAPDGVLCELTVRADAPFCTETGVDAVVALEYMAQAAGVFAGLATAETSRRVRPGFLIGCSELDLELAHIPIGTRLIVEVRQIWGDAELGQFSGTVRTEDEVPVASAKFNVARGPELPKSLNEMERPNEP